MNPPLLSQLETCIYTRLAGIPCLNWRNCRGSQISVFDVLFNSHRFSFTFLVASKNFLFDFHSTAPAVFIWEYLSAPIHACFRVLEGE
jgi:hypothetical protein